MQRARVLREGARVSGRATARRYLAQVASRRVNLGRAGLEERGNKGLSEPAIGTGDERNTSFDLHELPGFHRHDVSARRDPTFVAGRSTKNGPGSASGWTLVRTLARGHPRSFGSKGSRRDRLCPGTTSDAISYAPGSLPRRRATATSATNVDVAAGGRRVSPSATPEVVRSVAQEGSVATAVASTSGYVAYLEILSCPACKASLTHGESETLACTDPDCGRTFPIVDGRPVLIDETRSVFAIADYHSAASQPCGVDNGFLARLKTAARRLPSPSINLSAARCFATMKTLLLQNTEPPVVLVVGSGIQGKGMRALLREASFRIVNVDPSPTSDAMSFCDGHDLPFATGTIDAVVSQAVLEHVADPSRCVAEIHRVLKPDALVYSEIPFMQQVHERGYDFTRFTHLGHRRLFRCFTEIESGVVAGPGSALAWSWKYFLAAFASGPVLTKILFWVGRVTGILLEQTDYFFRQHPSSLDAASCVYFLGSRAETAIPDKALLANYRGAQRPS